MTRALAELGEAAPQAEFTGMSRSGLQGHRRVRPGDWDRPLVTPPLARQRPQTRLRKGRPRDVRASPPLEIPVPAGAQELAGAPVTVAGSLGDVTAGEALFWSF